MSYRDVVVTLRSLRRDARISATAVALLALGLGANAAIFAAADQILLRPPAGVDHPEQLRRFYRTTRQTIDQAVQTRAGFSYRHYDELRTALGERAELAAYVRDSLFLGDDAEAKVRASYVTGSYFGLLGADAPTGRYFASDEDVVESPVEVVVLSRAFWLRRFGGDLSVVGKTIDLGPHHPTVVGIAPSGFSGPDLQPTDVWLPIGTLPTQSSSDLPWYRILRSSVGVSLVARLSDPSVEESVRAMGTTLLRRSVPEERWDDAEGTLLTGSILETLAPLPDRIPVVRVTRSLMGVALLVLLIAAANVANLLLARAVGRRRDLAIHTALGRSRAQMARDVLLESVVLAVIAGVISLALASAGGFALRQLLLPGVEWTGGALDLRVAGVAMALALLIGLATGLPVALHADRVGLAPLLKSGPGAGGGRRSGLRSGMLAAQAALSVLLLVGAGLFVSSWSRVSGIDLGYDRDRLALATVDFRAPEGYVQARGEGHRDEMAAGMPAVADALRRNPAIESVALAQSGPLSGFVLLREGLYLPGSGVVPDTEGQVQALMSVSPSYFATTGMTLLRGRLFTEEDRRGTPVVVVDETAARVLWPGTEAVGKCAMFMSPEQPCREVVGVVRDTHLLKLIETPAVVFYAPLGQEGNVFDVRTPSMLIARLRPAAGGEAAIREEMRKAFPGAERIVVDLIRELLEPQMHPWRLSAILFAVFGLLALSIAMLGVYSAISYSVSQRSHEIAVRVAIGATGRRVMALVLRGGLGPVGAGAAAGLIGVLFAGNALAPLLYGTSPTDPAVIALSVGVLLLASVAACVVPGRRALLVDPVEVMRA